MVCKFDTTVKVMFQIYRVLDWVSGGLYLGIILLSLSPFFDHLFFGKKLHFISCTGYRAFMSDEIQYCWKTIHCSQNYGNKAAI